MSPQTVLLRRTLTWMIVIYILGNCTSLKALSYSLHIALLTQPFVFSDRLDAVLCYNHLPRFFTSLMSYYLSDHYALFTAAQNTMKVTSQCFINWKKICFGVLPCVYFLLACCNCILQRKQQHHCLDVQYTQVCM